jgi:hypothetical protein
MSHFPPNASFFMLILGNFVEQDVSTRDALFVMLSGMEQTMNTMIHFKQPYLL